jgi:hypothetical protein
MYSSRHSQSGYQIEVSCGLHARPVSSQGRAPGTHWAGNLGEGTEYKTDQFMVFMELIWGLSNMEPINTLCGQNAKVLNNKTGSKYNNHFAL